MSYLRAKYNTKRPFPFPNLKKASPKFPVGLRALSEVVMRTRAFFQSVSGEIALQEMGVVCQRCSFWRVWGKLNQARLFCLSRDWMETSALSDSCSEIMSSTGKVS